MTTATVESPLDRSLVFGMAWTAVLRWGAQLVSWAATLYAVRRLAPGDYGLVSMATVGIGMARMVEDFGLDSILVQDRSIMGQKEARLAGLLIGAALTLSLLFMVLAHPIAAFFHEPKLLSIIRVLSLLFVFDALQVVPRAMLQRNLEFRTLATVAFVQGSVTSIVLVAAVSMGLGYWSLVVNSIGGACATTALLYAWYPYAVAWPRDIRKMSAPLVQGWRILASRVTWYGYSNADQTIIGRFLGKDALGTYSFAVTFSSMALQEVGAVISRVVPGIFSRVQDSPQSLRRYFLLLTQFLAVITFPMAIGFAVMADPLVRLVLGPDWRSVTVPLQLLCLHTVFLSSQLLISHVLMWTGQFRIYMWCSILSGVTMPLAFLIAVRGGLQAIGLAWVVVLPLVNIPSLIFAFRTIEISAWNWLDSLKPALTGCTVMAIAVYGARVALPATLPLAAVAAISITTGILVYAAVLWLGFRHRVLLMLDVARAVRSNNSAPEKSTAAIEDQDTVSALRP